MNGYRQRSRGMKFLELLRFVLGLILHALIFLYEFMYVFSCMIVLLIFVYFRVQHVGLWSPTIIRGDDREAVHIPNHKFTVSVVRNLTQKSHWRIKTHLAISHLDVSKINVSNNFKL